MSNVVANAILEDEWQGTKGNESDDTELTIKAPNPVGAAAAASAEWTEFCKFFPKQRKTL